MWGAGGKAKVLSSLKPLKPLFKGSEVTFSDVKSCDTGTSTLAVEVLAPVGSVRIPNAKVLTSFLSTGRQGTTGNPFVELPTKSFPKCAAFRHLVEALQLFQVSMPCLGMLDQTDL